MSVVPLKLPVRQRSKAKRRGAAFKIGLAGGIAWPPALDFSRR